LKTVKAFGGFLSYRNYRERDDIHLP
jgi:hypothetical protein